MGLDNYWKDQHGKEGYVEGYFRVVGGLCSGNGNDSFRGKVYNEIVHELTGESLYQDKISSETVKEMNEAIQECEFERMRKLTCWEIEENEWTDFKRMWQAHSNAHHHLVSWWCGWLLINCWFQS